MGLKHTMKLVKKVLKDDDKNVLYTEEELMYMRFSTWTDERRAQAAQTTEETTTRIWLCQA